MRNPQILAAAAGVALLTLGPVVASATAPLFPRPLHIVRRIEDPLAKQAAVVDEYCAGNRIVSIRGAKVVITDYDAQQVTELDHAAATYSITRFDEIANARPKHAASQAHAQSTTPAATWKSATAESKRSAAGKPLESYAMTRSGEKLEIGIDRDVRLSRDAVEALIGASYPNARSHEHEALLQAAASREAKMATNAAGATSEAIFGLPAEQVLTIDAVGSQLVVRNTIVRIGDETVPAAALELDPGAKRVESRLTRLQRELDQLDRLPSQSRP
ncbi:MAG TPA: hypothetical protein VN605_10575 [Thermoanaerobaculia bacterium]|nr:hypothetical protein [Thermoanaerobaculia bacterium]